MGAPAFLLCGESELTIARLLLVLSLICFVLAMFHVALPVDLIALGLALFVAGHLV
jgi:hypothetical protein